MEDLIRDSKLVNIIKDKNLKNEFLTIYLKYSKFLSERMDLFEEYTDHSIAHINFVIETAEKLIPENTLNMLTELDIFTLLLSIVYHDMGMHLSKDGLKTLLNEDNIATSIDKNALHDEWEKYVKEISKLDDELEKLFENRSFSSKSFDENVAIEDDEVLREFVRRNHHRIAHEISLKGFPVTDGRINFGDVNYVFYHDLAGLIARSHGMNLREVFNYLKDEYYDDWKTPRNIYVIYLMVILRISDYLHITSDRVNPYRLRMFKFKSQKSRMENEKHLCTHESHRKYDSPRTLYITSEPKSLEVFLEMDNLLNSIQNELDICWAVLGEVYGNSNLEISIRRIDSNIKSKKWLDKQPFITEKINFKLDSRVMSLLIEPLYGNNPSFGIRELIQNATDACRELKAYDETKKFQVNIGYKTEQYIENENNEEKENQNHYLIIKDNGIGMSIETIKNYFLKIGSPYRKSKQWKESKDKNKEIVRNGRFGVGILSSFLLGEEITVKTQKANLGTKGDIYLYEFSTKLFSEFIDIKKCSASDKFEGTEIKIKLNDNAIKAVKEKTLVVDEWYKNNDIDIIVNIYQDTNEIAATKEIIDINNLKEWNNIEHKDFKDIKWSYDYLIKPIKWKVDYKNIDNYEMKLLKPNLVCNGIIIPENYAEKFSDKIIEKWPTVYVKDLIGNLDLDLSRYKLNSALPFKNELIRDIYQYYIFKLFEIKIFSNDKKNIQTVFKVNNFKEQKIVFLKNGFALCNPYFLKKIKPKKIVLVYTKNVENIDINEIDDDTAYIFEKVSPYRSHFKSEILNYGLIDEIEIDSDINIIVKKTILDEHMDEYKSNQVKFKQADRDKFQGSRKQVSETIDSIDISRNGILDLTYLNNLLNSVQLTEEDVKLIIEYSNVNNEDIDNYKYYKNIFDTYFGQLPIIPYNVEERKKSYSNLYIELEEIFKAK